MGGDDARGARGGRRSRSAPASAAHTRGLLPPSPDPTALWLFGREGADGSPRRLPPTSRGASSSRTRASPSCGGRHPVHGRRRRPLGYLSLAAHGHADALSVTVSSGGSQPVVDPETGTYFGRQADVRDAFPWNRLSRDSGRGRRRPVCRAAGRFSGFAMHEAVFASRPGGARGRG